MSEALRDGQGEEVARLIDECERRADSREIQDQGDSLEDIFCMHSWERIKYENARGHMGLYIIARQPDEFSRLIGENPKTLHTMHPPYPYLKKAITGWEEATQRNNQRRFNDFVVGATLDVLKRTPDPVRTPLCIPPVFAALHERGWFTDGEWSELQVIYEGSQITR